MKSIIFKFYRKRGILEIFQEKLTIYLDVFHIDKLLTDAEKQQLIRTASRVLKSWNSNTEFKQQLDDIYISTIFFLHDLLLSGYSYSKINKHLKKLIQSETDILNFDDAVIAIWKNDQYKRNGFTGRFKPTEDDLRKALSKILELDGFMQDNEENQLKDEADYFIRNHLVDTVIYFTEHKEL